jgi:hypothetical protein
MWLRDWFSGTDFEFQPSWWVRLSWNSDIDDALRRWRGITGSGVPFRHVECELS